MGIARASIRLRSWTVWLLIAALAVYGCSGALVRLLGPAHRHASAGMAAEGDAHLAALAADAVRAVRDWRAQMRERLPFIAGIDAIRHAHGRAGGHSHGRGAAAAGGGHAHPAAEPHVHSHDRFVRHHHDAADTSVMALDGGADDRSGSAGAGAATLTLALAPTVCLPVRHSVVASWAAAASAAWTDATTHPLERPPRS